MLLGGVEEPDGRLLHAAGDFTIPAAFAELERRSATLSHRDLPARVRRTYFPDAAEDAPVTHAETRRIGEVLVARFREILPDVAAVHAQVLLRQRFLLNGPGFAALPDDVSGVRPADSAILPSIVWSGDVTRLVRELGMRAQEPAELVSRGERLMATIRNSRPGGGDAERDEKA